MLDLLGALLGRSRGVLAGLLGITAGLIGLLGALIHATLDVILPTSGNSERDGGGKGGKLTSGV